MQSYGRTNNLESVQKKNPIFSDNIEHEQFFQHESQRAEIYRQTDNKIILAQEIIQSLFCDLKEYFDHCPEQEQYKIALRLTQNDNIVYPDFLSVMKKNELLYETMLGFVKKNNLDWMKKDNEGKDLPVEWIGDDKINEKFYQFIRNDIVVPKNGCVSHAYTDCTFIDPGKSMTACYVTDTNEKAPDVYKTALAWILMGYIIYNYSSLNNLKSKDLAVRYVQCGWREIMKHAEYRKNQCKILSEKITNYQEDINKIKIEYKMNKITNMKNEIIIDKLQDVIAKQNEKMFLSSIEAYVSRLNLYK